jgi:hypothetical protein
MAGEPTSCDNFRDGCTVRFNGFEDTPSPECCGLDKSSEHLTRVGMKCEAQDESSQSLIDENRAIAVKPVERQQPMRAWPE